MVALTCNSQPYISCPHVHCTINVIDQQIIVAFRLKKSNNAGVVFNLGILSSNLYNVKVVIVIMTSEMLAIYLFDILLAMSLLVIIASGLNERHTFLSLFKLS